MEQRLEELRKENNEEAAEYFQFIKSSVNDGSYFKDALNWYFFRYLTPICDRTLLIFGAIIAAVVFYFLLQMIQGAFPLVERIPVFVSAKDQASTFPSIVPLKPKKGTLNYDPAIATVDEAIAKYLLGIYVDDRESYDFSKAEIEDVNRKFARVRNVSSATEYKAFQLTMSKDNPASPIHSFGQNVQRVITIDSVRLIKKEPQDFASKARNFLSNKIPTEAEVRFTAVTRPVVSEESEMKSQKEQYVAKINFEFEGAKKDEKGVLKFSVNSYKLFKVK